MSQLHGPGPPGELHDAAGALVAGTVIGGKYELDEAGGSAYTPVALLFDLTVPNKAWDRVEAPELANCENFVSLGAAPQERNFSFSHYWHPGETSGNGTSDHDRLDAMWSAKSVGAWRAILPHDINGDQSVNPTIEWVGSVAELNPQAITNDGVITRDVVGILTSSAIIYGTFTPTP